MRQGDLYFTKINKLPEGLKKVRGNIIVRGESSGNAHRLNEGDIFSDKKGLLYLVIANKALVTHEEHKPIKLSKGVWAVKRQKEYMSSDMVRLVQD